MVGLNNRWGTTCANLDTVCGVVVSKIGVVAWSAGNSNWYVVIIDDTVSSFDRDHTHVPSCRSRVVGLSYVRIVQRTKSR